MKAIFLFITICICFGMKSGSGKPWPAKTSHEIEIEFIPVFNGKPLVLEKGNYISGMGDTLTISVFKFYVGEFALHAHEGKKEFKDYYLLDAEDTLSLKIRLTGIEFSSVSELSFKIGTDSITNTSGAMEGALDPFKGMYWEWNSGYINAKLEGKSSACKTLHHAFEFHIGGYQRPHFTQRTVHLSIPANELKSSVNKLTVYADAAAWVNKIQLSKINNIVEPSKAAAKMADAYARMFSIHGL